MKVYLIAFCMCVAILAGCNDKKAPPVAEQSAGKVLVIGLIPEQNLFKQMERYDPLAKYLQRRTGYQIKLVVLPRYGNIIEKFAEEGMDGAFFGSFTYALAHAKLGVNVIARPEDIDGRSAYHGLMFVRRDSGIKTAGDMRGKRFAFVDKATTAGYLLPLGYFHEHGIEDYPSYFGETYFAGTHEDAIYDVLNKKADIGAAKNTIFEKLAKSDRRLGKELVILERSPDVPENSLALRGDISGTIRKKLEEVLLSMHADPEGKAVLQSFGARKFLETKDEDFEPVRRYAKNIHLDLTTYNYRD